MKTCDCCGTQVNGGTFIGGAMLCRKCLPDVQAEIDKQRAEGKNSISAIGIAKRIYRETFSAGDYLLRDVPSLLMQEMKERALKEGGSVRDLILVSVSQYLAKK